VKLKEVDKDMQDRIIDMMSRTWDVIGSDVLQCNDGKDMPRSHVIEVVLDADHCGTYGDDKEAYQVLKQLSYKDMIALGQKAFKCAKYGL
jgi:hypothetical protein